MNHLNLCHVELFIILVDYFYFFYGYVALTIFFMKI